ncbi:hypothetical protein HDF26_001796 [Pedobacter cryoconitis]|nr:hypothetical protein [Pedobacter cryoconitis]
MSSNVAEGELTRVLPEVVNKYLHLQEITKRII